MTTDNIVVKSQKALKDIIHRFMYLVDNNLIDEFLYPSQKNNDNCDTKEKDEKYLEKNEHSNLYGNDKGNICIGQLYQDCLGDIGDGNENIELRMNSQKKVTADEMMLDITIAKRKAMLKENGAKNFANQNEMKTKTDEKPTKKFDEQEFLTNIIDNFLRYEYEENHALGSKLPSSYLEKLEEQKKTKDFETIIKKKFGPVDNVQKDKYEIKVFKTNNIDINLNDLHNDVATLKLAINRCESIEYKLEGQQEKLENDVKTTRNKRSNWKALLQLKETAYLDYKKFSERIKCQNAEIEKFDTKADSDEQQVVGIFTELKNRTNDYFLGLEGKRNNMIEGINDNDLKIKNAKVEQKLNDKCAKLKKIEQVNQQKFLQEQKIYNEHQIGVNRSLNLKVGSLIHSLEKSKSHETQNLKKREVMDQNAFLCDVCNVNLKNTMIFPCHHLSDICSECRDFVCRSREIYKKCNICNEIIQDTKNFNF